MPSTILYRVNSISSAPNSAFSVDEIADTQIAALPAGLSHLVNFQLQDTSYVLGLNNQDGTATTYSAFENGRYFNQVSTGQIPGAPTIVEPFYIANKPWLLTYNPSQKYAVFYSIGDDLSITERYKAKIGENYSTVKPFSYRFGIYFVAYDIKTGNVDRYQLSVPAQGYLHAQSTWTDLWAHGWTRFSFFQMGGENYFIKTNIDYAKVNIDHFMDDAIEGSHPVCDIPVPDQMKGLQNVVAFVNSIGDPYFATYRSNGEMTFNKFYGNILGWTVLLKQTAATNASLLQQIVVGEDNLIVLYTAE